MSRRTLLGEGLDWLRLGKGLLVAAVAGATVLRQADVSPGLRIACDVVIGIGAALGIASGGFSRKA